MKRSAGLLLYRVTDRGAVEVLIGHSGGPFWARKDAGSWSIPKGEFTDDEDPWDAARREFAEELGLPAPDGQRLELPPVKQRGGKVITAFAVRADLDVTNAVSNTFDLEWPPGSGVIRQYPELDRVRWFDVVEARFKLFEGQVRLLDRLLEHLATGQPTGTGTPTGPP